MAFGGDDLFGDSVLVDDHAEVNPGLLQFREHVSAWFKSVPTDPISVARHAVVVSVTLTTVGRSVSLAKIAEYSHNHWVRNSFS